MDFVKGLLVGWLTSGPLALLALALAAAAGERDHRHLK